MPLRWAPGLQRIQVIRRAAKILAIQRELAACTPDQWRIQELARLMIREVAVQAADSWDVRVALRPHSVRHLDLDKGTSEVESGWLVGVIHVGDGATGRGPCIHLADDEHQDPRCQDTPDLLDDPTFWTNAEAHDNLRDVVGLHGMACWQNETGPWQAHDPVKHAVHRAALAAYLCESAYHHTLTWHNPSIFRSSQPLNPVGMMHTLLGIESPEAAENTLEARFVAPWKQRFDELLRQDEQLELRDGRTKAWKFLRPGEDHWSLELCWAIVKESYKVRLDCPPLLVPLHALSERQGRTVEQTLFQYLVDDPQGPRMKATNAASAMGADPHNVHEILSQARRRVAFDDSEEVDELWDPLEVRRNRLMPMAIRSSDSAREAPTGAPTSSGPATAGTGGEPDSEE